MHQLKHINSYSNFVIEQKMGPRPAEVMHRAQFTSDFRYCLIEGRLYSTETGEVISLNEEWTLSDTLHAGADLLSAGLDIAFPGSGAIVDTLNTISYIIEAQFQDSEEKKNNLYLMAAITFAFVAIPGPIQAVAITLKNAVKSGGKIVGKAALGALKIVGSMLDTLLLKLPSAVSKALASPLASKVVGKWGTKISGFISKFTSKVKPLFEKLMATSSKEAEKTAAKAGEKATVKAGTKLGLTAITTSAKAAITKFASKMPQISISKLPMAFKKFGLSPGLQYRYLSASGKNAGKVTTVIFKGTTADGKAIAKFANGGTLTVPAETFLRNSIIEPWFRKGAGVMVPIFVKRLADSLLNDGSSIDYTKLESMADLDPATASAASLAYLEQEVASYEGETNNYTVNSNVTIFQQALTALGFPTKPDGKFGPLTQAAVTKYQDQVLSKTTDSKSKDAITASRGKLNRLTAGLLYKDIAAKINAGAPDAATLTPISQSLQTIVNKPEQA